MQKAHANRLTCINTPPPVGASLLAKNVNDNAGLPIQRSALRFFASKLAPTQTQGDQTWFSWSVNTSLNNMLDR